MSHEEFLISEKIWKITYFYDKRSEKRTEIEDFIKSDNFQNLEKSLQEETFLSLWWDGLFVFVAKIAHKENRKILWINFWNLGFLVQEKEDFCKNNEKINFVVKKYPILKAIIRFENGEILEENAFNEVYITRSWDASSLNLEISHLWKSVKNFCGDGIMISTPAGSTWWSKSYSWIILPHNANLNILTPIGTISPVHFGSLVLSDKWRIYIKNCSKRENSIDVLLDNKRLISHEIRNFELIIERDQDFVEVLIIKENLKKFEAKVYEIQRMSFA